MDPKKESTKNRSNKIHPIFIHEEPDLKEEDKREERKNTDHGSSFSMNDDNTHDLPPSFSSEPTHHTGREPIHSKVTYMHNSIQYINELLSKKDVHAFHYLIMVLGRLSHQERNEIINYYDDYIFSRYHFE